MIIAAILFDFDGTLTRPHAIDFAAMRREIDCPAGTPILEFAETVSDPARRRRIDAVLDRHEMDAAALAAPNEGAEETVRRLAAWGLPLAILTRNSRAAIERSLANFTHLSVKDFGIIITRNDAVRPKPDPAGVHLVARTLGVPVAEILCVGDFAFDIELAHNAGCRSVFVTNGGPRPAMRAAPDFEIARLEELIAIVGPRRPQ